MRQLTRLTPGKLAALLTLGLVAAVLAIGGGSMFSPGQLSAENRRNLPCGGVSSHAQLGGNCSACHAPPWSGQTMAERCLDCHTDVRRQIDTKAALHGTLAAGTRCQYCHSEHRGAHAALTDLSKFDHNCAAFKLTGAHVRVNCSSCHVNNAFKGTAQTCVGCHAEPSVPQVHKGAYGTDCIQCHSTTAWRTAGKDEFDHNRTAFKLTGAHMHVSCASCHANNVFKGLSQTCVSCHAQPKTPEVHKVAYGANCVECHTTTTWKNASGFDHNRTAFKLTGAHVKVNCASCHVNNVFKGTTQTCVSCHVEPKAPEVHKQKYGTNCVHCHTTATWKDSTFKHTFPINHGHKRSGGNTCATCHQSTETFATYTCYNCHEHTQAKMERIHARRKVANLEKCAECHKMRRGRERSALPPSVCPNDAASLADGAGCPHSGTCPEQDAAFECAPFGLLSMTCCPDDGCGLSARCSVAVLFLGAKRLPQSAAPWPQSLAAGFPPAEELFVPLRAPARAKTVAMFMKKNLSAEQSVRNRFESTALVESTLGQFDWSPTAQTSFPDQLCYVARCAPPDAAGIETIAVPSRPGILLAREPARSPELGAHGQRGPPC